MSKPVIDTEMWEDGEAPDFWRKLKALSESDDEEEKMEISPKQARLLLYAAGP